MRHESVVACACRSIWKGMTDGCIWYIWQRVMRGKLPANCDEDVYTVHYCRSPVETRQTRQYETTELIMFNRGGIPRRLYQ